MNNNYKNKLLNILGIIFMIIGGACIFFIPFKNYFKSFKNIQAFLPLIGVVVFIIGYKVHENKKIKNVDEDADIKEEKIVCQICGKENTTDTKFCISCGRNLLKECNKCKTENPKNARFCKNCGERL